MKALISFLLLATVLVLFACDNTEGEIKEAAYCYSYAMANYDIDGAEPYADEETRQTTLTTGRLLLQSVDKSYIGRDTPATITIEDIAMLNDTAAVVNYHKVTPIKDFRDTLEVRKYGQRWLVHTPIKVIQQELPPEIASQIGEKDGEAQ